MSKNLSPESLQNIINEYANVSNSGVKIKQNNKKEKNKTKKNIILVIAIISILLNAMLGSLLILKNSQKNYKNEYNACNTKLKKVKVERYNYKLDSDNLNDILDGKEYWYVSNKLQFFDNNIVFIIDGFGNYYYSYDCMKQKVGNNAFVYWAYNKEAAINKGYYEGSCN